MVSVELFVIFYSLVSRTLALAAVWRPGRGETGRGGASGEGKDQTVIKLDLSNYFG